MNVITKYKSPNHSARNKKIDYIIIHYTEMLFDDALKKLCSSNAEVSAHYLIKDTGEILRLVEDKDCAWHAGESYWKGLTQLNEHSIGIELDNNGKSAYPAAQMESCLKLCNHLIQLYDIPVTNILAHSDVAPNRKIDPGVFFDWSYLAKNKIGMWFDNDCNKYESIICRTGDNNEEVKELQNDLKLIGYKINITGTFDRQTNYALRAFLLHFQQNIIAKSGTDFGFDNELEYHYSNITQGILKNLISKL